MRIIDTPIDERVHHVLIYLKIKKWGKKKGKHGGDLVAMMTRSKNSRRKVDDHCGPFGSLQRVLPL